MPCISWPTRSATTLTLTTALLLASVPNSSQGAGPGSTTDTDVQKYAAWVEQMKTEPRGPFKRLRWFCADGTVHPPRPYPCKERGGGVQHGEYSERASAMRADGFLIATVLADFDSDGELAHADARHRIAQILVERFLVQVDDGWILRRARFYRGALQEEDERAGARALLLAMLSNESRISREYALIRSAARLLPHGEESQSASKVRQLSADLSDRDAQFLKLRNKIHVQPEAGDAAAVRDYAKGVTDSSMKADFESLAHAIDALFQAQSSAPALERLAKRAKKYTVVANSLRDAARALAAEKDEAARFQRLAQVLAALRDSLPKVDRSALRLQILDASLLVESELFVSATRLSKRLDGATRRERLMLADATVSAIYGSGLVSARQRAALDTTLSTLAPGSVSLALYKSNLDQLKLVPAWSAERLRFHFGRAMHTLGQLEPKTQRFIEDQLRGSPLFFFAKVLDALLRDANQLAGVRSTLFKEELGSGLRALNPGLARGMLLEPPADRGAFDSAGIYILPETESDLPPVAGILTAGEGNPLSHVQLLARNLGIPNVGVDEALLPKLAPFTGRRVLMAVSSAGSVELTAYAAQHDALFASKRSADEQSLIRPDLKKLDLEQRNPLTLSDLRARDSGRTVGPKAAKLGELKNSYPEAVEEGLAIPFGIFAPCSTERTATADSACSNGCARIIVRWTRCPKDPTNASSARKHSVRRSTTGCSTLGPIPISNARYASR